ncbi:hypothetical protein GCM10010145_15450 [Streptomyces ruber]|uniref:Isoprenyl transferase n=2 Tax=Streptomyces TaxID=1883 RepID=A0A918BA12_9ACTN|nr:hypothetical protein GCM10010145_15450 [Streptomyces ruber]
MSHWWRCLRTAVRYAVREQARNRAALVPAVLIVPLWLGLAHLVLPADPVRFPLRAADRTVRLAANEVAGLSGALHSLTLVVGFMMFLSTSRCAVFYGHLARAGCPRACLAPAQGSVLLLWAVSAAGYATAWVCVFGRPERIDVPALALALCVGALVYGAAGVLLASVTRSEAAGLFMVTSVGFVDLTLQNPVAGPWADAPLLSLLPAYGAMQSAVAAVGTGGTPWRHLLLGMGWAAALSLAGLLVPAVRARGRGGPPATRGRARDGGARERSPGDRMRGGSVRAGGVPGQVRAVSEPPPAPPAVVRVPWRRPGPGRVYRAAGITDPAVRAGYEACRRLVRDSGRLDRAVGLLLPAGLRPLLWAVHGHARTVDALAGAPDDTPRRRAERVAAHSRALETELRRGHSTDPVRAALVDAVWRWDLPGDGLPVTAAGHRTDTTRETRLLTWADWQAYGDRLSFPFGISRLLALLTGPGLSLTAADADALRRWGDAHRLVGALRELCEDARQGSVELPHDVLDEYGVTADDLRRPQRSERVTALVRALADRADAWLAQAARLGAQHPPAAAAWRTLVALQRLELDGLRRRPRGLRRTADHVRFQCLLLGGRLRVARAWRRARTAAVAPPAPPPLPVPRPAPADPPAARAVPLPPLPHPDGVRPPRLPAHRLPRHVAIVMDGNGRWAADRGLPRGEGHGAGGRALRDIVHGALEIGLPCLSVYALSTENWSRTTAETENILRALRTGLDLRTEELWRRDVRLLWSGSADGLPADVVRDLRETVHATRDRAGLTLNLCFNYGGRDEIALAARALARRAVRGELAPDRITARHVGRHLHQPELPDVDLLVRTAGERRTSDFLPWQAACAELVFLDTLWPDADRTHLWDAVRAYTGRERRSGSAGTGR